MMMRLLIALGFLAAAATTAQAQYADFRPLHMGNVWVYRTDEARSAATTQCPDETAFVRYTRAEVVRDTTLDGEAARVVSCVTLDEAGTPTAGGEFAVALGFGATTTAGDAPPTCRSLFLYGTPLNQSDEMGEVVVGGTAYEVLTRYALLAHSLGTGGAESALSSGYGEPFGQYVYSEFARGHAVANPSCSSTQRTLEYARIDGETYGALPVSDERPPTAASPALRAYPSPASARVTVEAAAGAFVEVVSLLGRRVATGTVGAGGRLGLDASAWPAGVYILRASLDGVSTTMQVVVAR